MNEKTNTRIYSLISVPQITRLLLGDAIISSKTDPHNGSKKEKRSYGEVKNNNTMLMTLMGTLSSFHKSRNYLDKIY